MFKSLSLPSSRSSRIRFLYWMLAVTFVVNAYFASSDWYLAGLISHFSREDISDQIEPYRGAAVIAPVVQKQSRNKRFFFPGHHDGIEETAQWRPLTEWQLPFDLGDGFSQCLTYKERYEGYDKPLPRWLWKPARKSRAAVTLRIISSQMVAPIRPDSLLFLRSLIFETEVGAGLDVYLLVDSHSDNGNIEDWLPKVPEEFRSRVLPFYWSDVQASYPKDVLGWIWSHNHMTTPMFLNHPLGRRYSWVWQMERDVRLIGGSWVQFFNNFNATTTPEGRSFLQADYYTDTNVWTTPDFVSLMGLRAGYKLGDFEKGCIDSFALEKSLRVAYVQIWGASRKMGEKIEELARNSKNCHIEMYLPTMARQFNLTWHSPPIPTYDSPNTSATTYHCCHDAAAVNYRQWMNNETLCRRGPWILHAFREERPAEIWLPGIGPKLNFDDS